MKMPMDLVYVLNWVKRLLDACFKHSISLYSEVHLYPPFNFPHDNPVRPVWATFSRAHEGMTKDWLKFGREI